MPASLDEQQDTRYPKHCKQLVGLCSVPGATHGVRMVINNRTPQGAHPTIGGNSAPRSTSKCRPSRSVRKRCSSIISPKPSRRHTRLSALPRSMLRFSMAVSFCFKCRGPETSRFIPSDQAQCAEEVLQTYEQGMFIVRLALPYNQARPTHSLQINLGGSIASPRRFEFSIPVFDASRWSRGPGTSFVTMPETPVNENNLAPTPEHYVRPTRKIARMQSKPIAMSVKEATDAQLRASIFLADPRHQCASLTGRQRVGAHREETNELHRQVMSSLRVGRHRTKILNKNISISQMLRSRLRAQRQESHERTTSRASGAENPDATA